MIPFPRPRRAFLGCAGAAVLALGASCRGGGREDQKEALVTSAIAARDLGPLERRAFGQAAGPTGQGGPTLGWVTAATEYIPSGSSVAVSDGVVVDGWFARRGGAVIAYFGSGATWTAESVASIPPGIVGPFGAPVAVSSGSVPTEAPTVVVAGVPTETVGTNVDQGAAYAYSRGAPKWLMQERLIAPDGHGEDLFGSSVSLSAGVAVVGAPGSNAHPGAAYVFVQSGTAWPQQQPALTAPDGAPLDSFGASVSVSGSTAVVGAPGKAFGASAAQGAAYVFEQSGQTWSFERELEASDGAANDAFGSSVSIAGDTIVVGAPGKTVGSNGGQGAAYLFTRAGGAWPQLQPRLTAEGGGPFEKFGCSVAVSTGVAFIGASYAATAGSPVVGAVYVFGTSSGTWAQQQKINAQGGLAGLSVAVRGDLAAIAGTGGIRIEAFGPANGSACTVASACASGNCAAGWCCDHATPCSDPCQSCGTGTCTTLPKRSPGACSLYACDGTLTTCPTSCGIQPDCAANAYCDTNLLQCVPQRGAASRCSLARECLSGNCFEGFCLGTAELGESCTYDTDCASNTCVDGVCCDGPCQGQCEACDVQGHAGRCAPVSGPPHWGRPSCAIAGSPCGGTCDGATNTAACAHPPTVCGSVCEGAGETVSTCDGQGNCVPGAPHSCNNFICADSATCKTACATVADCIAGFSCHGGTCHPGGATCIDNQTSQAVIDGRITGCAPFLCDQGSGACRGECSTVTDCVDPNVCDPVHKRCIAPPSSGGQLVAGGCRAAGPEGELPGGPGALLALLSAGIVRGIRRRRA